MADTSVQKTVKSAHFIGIGGAGMSGIALVLHERGCKVTGSDLKHSHYVRELGAAGIPVSIGHEAAPIDAAMPEGGGTSTAIPESNPEGVRARELGIPIWPRAKMLSYLSGAAKTVAVAGTHGKTTTSSMVATMMDRLGMDPSFLIGGVVEGYDTNGRNGDGGYFVCEADESDGSFLYLHPNVVVVTNIEADHLDHYGTLENIEKTFCKFMDLVGEDGAVVIFGDNPHYVELARSTGRHVGPCGGGAAADVLRGTDVFSAGEQPIPGVSGKTVVNSVREHDASKDVEYIPNRHELVDALVELVRPGDLLITQGAGDVTTIGPAFVEAMRARDAKRA